MMSFNLSDIAILKIKNVDYLCIITGISKIEAINLMKNIDLTEKSRISLKHKNLLSYIKVGKNIFMLGNIGIEENTFWEDRDIKRVLVSKKTFPGEKSYKYFIDYLHNHHKVKPLHIMLSKTNAYVKKVMMGKQSGYIFWLKMMTY